MLTLADISTGNTATADVLFLLAAIVFGLAALAYLVLAGRTTTAEPVKRVPLWWLPAAVPAGLCLVSVAWLVL